MLSSPKREEVTSDIFSSTDRFSKKDADSLHRSRVTINTSSFDSESRRSRKVSFRLIYSQTSLISVRAGHAVMRFLKGFNGVGIFLGLICAFLFSLGSLIVKVLNSNYHMHPFMLSAIRQGFLLFLAGPQVAYCKAPYFGKTKSEWFFLTLRAACGGIGITLNFMAISYLTIGDVAVIYATTPAFTTLLAWIILREKCHVSDIPVLFIAFLGVLFILRPPVIFKHLFPTILMNEESQGITSQDRVIGSACAISGAIAQAGQYLALRKLRKVSYATISFFYALSTAPILLAVTGAMGKLQMPPCYLDRLMAIGIAASAQGAHIFLTLAAKFVPPGLVSLTRSAEVAFGFIWQAAFLGVSINLFSIIGLSLVAISMLFLSFRQVITDKYGGQKPKNTFIKILLIISK